MPIIITGANDFIGRALCQNLPQYDNVLGIDIKKGNFDNKNVKWKIADLTDFNIVSDICKKHISDVIIHCAGIAHQKIGAVDSATYIRMNSDDWYVLPVLAQGLPAVSVASRRSAVILEGPS